MPVAHVDTAVMDERKNKHPASTSGFVKISMNA